MDYLDLGKMQEQPVQGSRYVLVNLLEDEYASGEFLGIKSVGIFIGQAAVVIGKESHQLPLPAEIMFPWNRVKSVQKTNRLLTSMDLSRMLGLTMPERVLSHSPSQPNGSGGSFNW